MAKLFEYQGKDVIKKFSVPVPNGRLCRNVDEALEFFRELKSPVVLKIQLWKTGRKKIGGVRFAETEEELSSHFKDMMGMEVDGFKVDSILVEEKLNIRKEFFAGIIVDDRASKPLVLFSSIGGTGIEEIARENPGAVVKFHVDIIDGLQPFMVREKLVETGLEGKELVKTADVIVKLYRAFREYDARSLETNPLVLTEDGRVVAADCHMVIDDYAVYRHKDLGIEIAREFPRPPTELEKIAYRVEESDYRGTFYFIQMVEDVPPDGKHIGFHGAGGGGSMMSMDAVHNGGLIIANFTDTSGNPPASKVYRAAKIILSQPNIVGYFASGSGVASQEQFNSARGFVKAFLEEDIDIPAVLRLGGNYEELAIEILDRYLKSQGYKVEGYGKDTSPDECIRVLKDMMGEEPVFHKVRPVEEYEPEGDEYEFETMTGKVFINHRVCVDCEEKPCIEACSRYGVLTLEEGKPVLALEREEVKKGKCTECLACEIACRFHGKGGLHIVLPIEGLKEYREGLIEHNR